MSKFLGLLRLQKLCWVILGPRRIFLVLPEYGVYRVLRGVTAFACDNGYGLFFSNCIFTSKKIDFVRIAQWKKNKPRALFLIASSF